MFFHYYFSSPLHIRCIVIIIIILISIRRVSMHFESWPREHTNQTVNYFSISFFRCYASRSSTCHVPSWDDLLHTLSVNAYARTNGRGSQVYFKSQRQRAVIQKTYSFSLSVNFECFIYNSRIQRKHIFSNTTEMFFFLFFYLLFKRIIWTTEYYPKTRVFLTAYTVIGFKRNTVGRTIFLPNSVVLKGLRTK